MSIYKNINLKIEDREAYPKYFPFTVLVGSLLSGLVLIGIVFLSKGVNPFFAIYKIFAGSFGSFYGFKETITKAIPLILIASGLVVAFRGKFWNIGAEGQLLVGAIVSAWIGLFLGRSLPGFILVPLMFLGGFLGGAVYAFIPAVFKIRFGINEVISTLMLNYIAAELMKLLVVGPWKGATKFGFPYTDDLPAQGSLWLIPGSRIHLFTLILALLCAFIMWLLIYRTRFGYEIRVIGENHEAAKYAGIDFFKTSLLMMFISGGLAGFAGTGEFTGIHHHLAYPYAISSGYGFTAIIVAWLAKLNPLYVIVSGLFFAGILVGGDAIQISLGLPVATVDVFNGLILFALIAGDFFLKNKINITFKKQV